MNLETSHPPGERRRPSAQDPAEGCRAIASPRDSSERLRPAPEDSGVTLEVGGLNDIFRIVVILSLMSQPCFTRLSAFEWDILTYTNYVL